MDINTEHSAIVILLLLIALPLAGFSYGFRKGRENLRRGDLMAPPADLGGVPGAPGAPSPPPAPLSLPAEAERQVREALRRGNKIGAIKILRDATGLGLAESKDAVEAMEEKAQKYQAGREG